MTNTAKRALGVLAITTLVWSSAAKASSELKPAQTEVQKAAGKCAFALIGGAALGGILGRGKGALIGAGAGGALCAILLASAKHQDKIIAAQRAAAAADDMNPRSSYFEDEHGKSMTIAARAEVVADPGNVRPVSYQRENGTKFVTPTLGDGPKICRNVHSEMSGGSGSQMLPNQLFCRTPGGDWEPYAASKA